MLVTGRVQTGTYDKDGVKIPFFEVVVEDQEFAEGKNATSSDDSTSSSNDIAKDKDGFMHISDDLLEELPFN